MKSSVRRLASRLLPVLFSCSLTISLCANQDWYNSYEEALAAAKREGKPIFADFSTVWCHNCKQLDRETLSDPNIEARLDNFIKLRIDGDQRADVVQRYQVDAYPTMITLDPNGRMVDKTVGFVRPPQLAGSLDNQMQMLAPALAQMQSETASAKASKEKGNSSKNGAKSADAKSHELDSRMASASGVKPESKVAGVAGRNNLPLAPAQPATASRGQLALASTQQPGGSPAAERYRIQHNTQLQQPAISQPRTVAQADTKPASASTAREIMPLLSTSRNASPGGGSGRHSEDELVVSQAAPRTTPASSISSDESANDELPRPLLKTGSRAGSSALATGSGKSESGSAKATGSSVKAIDNTPAPTEKAPADDDAMSTIRKLQKNSKNSKASTASAKTPEAAKSETASEKSAAPDKIAAGETSSKTAPRVSPKVAEGSETAPAPEPAKAPSAGEASATQAKSASDSASSDDSEKASKSNDVTEADIERWTKDADSKLIAGHKREARAMYAHVYEKDPKNKFGKSDMAYIKMVSLMVDQDDDALRRKALNKIKEFEALFPDSEHKDYYTLIRATLAADLGDTNAAHRLLETFADRFPDSKYQKLAYQTWKSLPPVKKDTSSKEVAAKESSPQKSKDKKKKAEE